MTETLDSSRVPRARMRRLLVALDASASSLDALDELARLAAQLELDMRGLFVEDTDLLDLVGHRVVSTYPTVTQGLLDSQTIERTMRHHVATARRAVEALAGRRQVPVRFEVRRGRTAFEVVRSAGDDELVVISRHARGFTMKDHAARLRTGQTAQEVVRETEGPVFVLGSVRSLQGPLYVAFDGTHSSVEALELAGAIAAHPDGRPLVVLLWVANMAEVAGLRRAAEALVTAHGMTASYETVAQHDLETLCAAVSARQEGVLVLGDPALPREGAQDLVERLRCSVLLVR